MPLITVFTPTFNRAQTLNRVYQSLLNQTFRDFEWIIVDDGSLDGTSKLVQEWICDGVFNIRYFYQRNLGKHFAFNVGVIEASGELFLPLDSDDACVSWALERFSFHWDSIPSNIRDLYSGITCLCYDQKGKVIGGALPSQTIDGHPYEVMSSLNRKGEMWGFHRTEILRQFKFPEIPGEKFVPEGLIWNRIGKEYLIRFINEPLREYYDSKDGLSNGNIQLRINNPISTIAYYSELLYLPLPIYSLLKAAINIWRFSLLSHHTDLAYSLLKEKPIYMGSMFFIGGILATRDLLFLNIVNRN